MVNRKLMLWKNFHNDEIYYFVICQIDKKMYKKSEYRSNDINFMFI